MKFIELLENIIDVGADNKLNEPPERKPNMDVLVKKIQEAIYKAFQSSDEVKQKLNSATVLKIEGPNVHLRLYEKGKNPTTAVLPMLYLKKYLNNPQILANILLKKAM